MGFWAIFWIVIAVIALVLVGLYFWGRKLQKKYDQQQQMISDNKQSATVFVIDKKKDYVTNLKLPKQVKEQLPWMYKKRKMPVVIAKIGPQIQTLLCDQKIYDVIPTKKQIKVELAGILIVNVVSGRLPDTKKKTFISKLAKKVEVQREQIKDSTKNSSKEQSKDSTKNSLKEQAKAALAKKKAK